MTAAEDVVNRIRATATDEHDKGDRFERLMLHAFRTDRTYAQQFTHMWRWMDWPERSGADIGVDLVARNTDGTLTAIQCKCYAPTTTLTKEEIDTFVALSGRNPTPARVSCRQGREPHAYELGSRSAIAWVIESNRVRTDKASGILNDPNDWAIEHDDPTHILDLVGRVVTVSMQTLDVVESLPKLEL